MNKAKIDVAVLILFFNRPKLLEKVFEQVKIARPSKLYLFQDGAREDRIDDITNIQKCRDIVADIDWECDVHRNYQEKNNGCDPSEYLAQKWMFETEEMGIILEDDDVPSQSFFPFCKELLERYKADPRVNMICGMNNTGISPHINTSYLYTKKGSIWGWASWKRVIDTWDSQYRWMNDQVALEKIRSYLTKVDYERFITTAERHRNSGKAHYESINAAAQYLHNSFNIVPKYNMICNIGIGTETTHSTADIRLLPRRIQKLLYMKTYEIQFPLVHPEIMVCDRIFEKKMLTTRFHTVVMRLEAGIRSLIYQGPIIFCKRVMRRIALIVKVKER